MALTRRKTRSSARAAAREQEQSSQESQESQESSQEEQQTQPEEEETQETLQQNNELQETLQENTQEGQLNEPEPETENDKSEDLKNQQIDTVEEATIDEVSEETSPENEETDNTLNFLSPEQDQDDNDEEVQEEESVLETTEQENISSGPQTEPADSEIFQGEEEEGLQTNLDFSTEEPVNSEQMDIESPSRESESPTIESTIQEPIVEDVLTETATVESENIETENIESEIGSFNQHPIEEEEKLEKDDQSEVQTVSTQNVSDYQPEESEKETEEIKGTQQKSKKKKKRRRKRAKAEQRTVEVKNDEEDDFEVEYVSEKIDLPQWDPNYAAFQSIFETFKLEEKTTIKEEEEADKKVEVKKPVTNLVEEDDDDDDDEDDPDKEKKDEPEKLSKKQLKKQSRMAVATLKQMVTRPDVVEMHDVNSKDPQLLVYLKAYKNTVPVPRHWCFKRKYLAGKRGFLKNPFDLPDFIKQTGIMEMRAAMQEKEDAKTLKSKQRGKIRPKLGKIDIDYQKLHDAFFKFQTKPKMTIHGDLYYEGKEFEIRLKEKKPGDLSDDLRTALGMPVGQGKNNIPPPWLIAMQRYGPPPSYPNLKIPGLNAPIPEGASFGYHAGGWGKPPVDEMGKPLYGDVFGTSVEDAANVVAEETVDKTPWGELESESESEEESEDEDEDEDQTGLVTPGDAGLITPSGMSSVGAGLETPDMIELRKRKEIEDAMETGGDTPALYTVLAEKKTNVGASMMGSQHTYELAPSKKAADGVEITLDPSELELEPAAMAAKYDDTMKEREANVNREDFSDMVAEHAAKKKRKRPTDSGKGAKKYKEFKF